MIAAPSCDSVIVLVGAVRDITSLTIKKVSGKYSISGTKVGGGAVSWSGTSRTNALLQMDKWEARLA